MKNNDDGGGAFPFSNGMSIEIGMTLRQWYAGIAMQGMLANGELGTKADCKIISGYAFEQADSMLEFEQNEKES